MQPFPRKDFFTCPQCTSPRVEVPWSIDARGYRRRLAQQLGFLWLTVPLWLAAVLILRPPLVWWLAPAAAYTIISARIVMSVRRSLLTFQCADCAHEWSERTGRPNRED